MIVDPARERWKEKPKQPIATSISAFLPHTFFLDAQQSTNAQEKIFLVNVLGITFPGFPHSFCSHFFRWLQSSSINLSHVVIYSEVTCLDSQMIISFFSHLLSMTIMRLMLLNEFCSFTPNEVSIIIPTTQLDSLH